MSASDGGTSGTPTDRDEGLCARALDGCDGLLADHRAGLLQRFGAPVQDLIDLPPISTGEIVSEQVGATAVLFWAMHVEQAGLPGFVEAMAEQFTHGRLLLPLTSGGDRLMLYWRARHQRLTADERAAIYSRIFGAGVDSGPFSQLFDRLVSNLAELGRATSGVDALGTAAAVAAQDLGAYLSPHGAGMSPFAARDITDHIRAALALLRDPDIAGALGVGGPWAIVRVHSPTVLGHAVDPSPHLDEAHAGLTLLRWIAGHAAGLPRTRISAGSMAIRAALEWQAAHAGP